MANKLPIFKTVGDAFGMALRLPFLHTGFFFTYLLILLVYTELLGFVAGFFRIAFGIAFDEPVLHLIFRIIWWPVVAPFAVPIHRHIILHEAIPSPRALLRSIFTKRNATFAGYALLILFPAYFIAFLVELPKIGFPIWFGYFGILQIPVTIVIAGIIIFLPFIAIDNRQTFARCWAKTRGNILRVFAVSLIISVVAATVAWLVFVPLQTAALSPRPSGAYAWVGVFLIDAVIDAFLLISAAWAVAAVSHVFVFLSQGGEDKNAVIP